MAIALDDYEEIFDDFDTRAYSARAISQDFIDELRKRITITGIEKIKIIFTVPNSKRQLKEEKTIRKRLQEFFPILMKKYQRKYEKIRNRGILYVGLGFSILTIATFFELGSHEDKLLSFLTNVLFVPSWFLIWTGMEKILEDTEQHVKTIKFYEMLSKSDISFETEENYNG